MNKTNRICLALDTPDRSKLWRLVEQTQEHVGAFKVGLTAFASLGPHIVHEVAARRPVFLDLKLHDIPVQVAGAVERVARTGAIYTTVHAAGGSEMVAAAASAAAGRVAILAVTVLTSLDDAALHQIGFADASEKVVLRLAELALEAGADGLVCSPLEVAALRRRFDGVGSPRPLLVVPGIRSTGARSSDQRRTLSAREAVEAGADLVVVGRPVTEAADPATAAAALQRQVGG